jgi:hypothetical protein
MDRYIEGANNLIEIAKFAMCGLCLFVHVKYIIVVTKTFIVVQKTIMLSSKLMDVNKIG